MTVSIGTAIVSYIEPHPGRAVEFNRWYEHDHFPAAVTAGPGVFAGARFVATRACKELRPRSGVLFGDPGRGSYLAVAWVLPGKQAEWDAWVAREMETIAAEGRLFPGRDHVHTAIYECIQADGDAIVALDRALAGTIVIAERTPLGDLGAELPADGRHSSIRLRLDRTIISGADPPQHELAIGFYEDDPVDAFRALADRERYGFASPFLATVPGTDTYARDL